MRSDDAHTGEHELCSPMDESTLEDSEPVTPTPEERVALGLDEQRRLRDFLHAERWTWASFLVHAIAVYCIALLPPQGSALALDMLNDDVQYARYLTTPVAREPLELFEPGPNQSGESGERAAESEGQAGKSDAPRSVKRMSGGGRDRAKNEPSFDASNAGILGVLKTRSRFVPDGPGSFDVRGMGDGELAAFGAIMGSTVGDSFGFNGLGMRGTGRGGGGDAQGSVGVGQIGRFGAGLGAGCPGCALTGRNPRREGHVPHLRPGAVDVVGSLSKEVIRRVIQRHANEVRFCYEEGLRRTPELAGRVEVKFVIAPSGAVQNALVASNTLAGDQARTSQCIAEAVKRWSFPAPDGGGVVVVSYPFLLETAN